MATQASLHRTNGVLGPLLTGAAYYVAAALSLYLTEGANGVAAIWPSSGILFAILLVVPRRMAGRYVATAALASMTANLGAGNSWPVAIAFTLANMGESSFAAWMLRRHAGGAPSFVNLVGIGFFCGAAFSASAASASFAMVAASMVSPAFFFSWFSTDLLGMLVVAPMILIAVDLRRSLSLAVLRRRIPQTIAVLACVVATTALTFGQSSYPLLFLPMIALLLAVFRLGTFGAAASVFIIAVGGSIGTSLGLGPVQLVQSAIGGQVLFLQFYLLALFVSALPVAALLAARTRLTATLAESNRLLAMAESVARVGHWRVDARSQILFWSAEVFRIHAVEHGLPPQLDAAIEAYHPADRAAVEAKLDAAMTAGEAFEFTARIVRPDGSIRHVYSRGEADIGIDGAVVGLFGIVQDVSAQVAVEEALVQARHSAEAMAIGATRIAETDELTGLANRRRILYLLDRAIEDAATTGSQLSVAMFDIDHFKRVNDTYGHAVGDAVLCHVAATASGALREGDLLGRVGGEEFVLVLPGADPERATEIAERVRIAIVAQDGGSKSPRVSASFGVAAWSSTETSGDVLKRADTALYQAKAGGRNTLRLAA